MYKLTNNPNLVIRKEDNATIPAAANLDYQEYLAWLAEGNTPEPLPEETPEQTLARLEGVLDRHLDDTANQYRYESIRTMVTYEGDPDPEFHAQGTAAKKYRSAVYRLGINKIKACTREIDPLPIPTEAELIAELPKFEDFLQA